MLVVDPVSVATTASSAQPSPVGMSDSDFTSNLAFLPDSEFRSFDFGSRHDTSNGVASASDFTSALDFSVTAQTITAFDVDAFLDGVDVGDIGLDVARLQVQPVVLPVVDVPAVVSTPSQPPTPPTVPAQTPPAVSPDLVPPTREVTPDSDPPPASDAPHERDASPLDADLDLQILLDRNARQGYIERRDQAELRKEQLDHEAREADRAHQVAKAELERALAHGEVAAEHEQSVESTREGAAQGSAEARNAAQASDGASYAIDLFDERFAAATEFDAAKEGFQRLVDDPGSLVWGVQQVVAFPGTHEVRLDVAPDDVVQRLFDVPTKQALLWNLNPTQAAGTCGNTAAACDAWLGGAPAAGLNEMSPSPGKMTYQELVDRAAPFGGWLPFFGLSDLPLLLKHPGERGMITFTVNAEGFDAQGNQVQPEDHVCNVVNCDGKVTIINPGGSAPPEHLSNFRFFPTSPSPPVETPGEDGETSDATESAATPGAGSGSGGGEIVHPGDLLMNRDRPVWSSVFPPVEVPRVEVELFPGVAGGVDVWQEEVPWESPDGWDELLLHPRAAADDLLEINLFTSPLGFVDSRVSVSKQMTGVEFGAPLPGHRTVASDSVPQPAAAITAADQDTDTKVWQEYVDGLIADWAKMGVDLTPGDVLALTAGAGGVSSADLAQLLGVTVSNRDAALAKVRPPRAPIPLTFLSPPVPTPAPTPPFVPVTDDSASRYFEKVTAQEAVRSATLVPIDPPVPVSDQSPGFPRSVAPVTSVGPGPTQPATPTGTSSAAQNLWTGAVDTATHGANMTIDFVGKVGQSVAKLKQGWDKTLSVTEVTGDVTGQSSIPWTYTLQSNDGTIDVTYDGETGKRIGGNGPGVMDPQHLYQLYRATYTPKNPPFVFGRPGAAPPVLPSWFRLPAVH